MTEIWKEIEGAGNPDRIFEVVKSSFLDTATPQAGSAVFYKLGKALSAKLTDQSDWLSFLQRIWDEGGRAGKLVGLALLSTKVDDPGAIVPALYRLALSAESQEVAEKLGVGVLEKVVRSDRENFNDLLTEWQTDENEGVSVMAKKVKERIGEGVSG